MTRHPDHDTIRPFYRLREVMAAPRKRWLIAIVTVLLACTVAGSFALAVDDIRWRAAIIAMKATGRIQGVGWAELLSMLKPGSMFYLKPLLDNGNPYAAIHNPHTTGADVQAGEHTFTTQCASCHGPLGRGRTAPSLVGRTLKEGDADWSLFRTVRGGRPDLGMPAIPMSELEAWQVVSYLRRLRNGADAQDDQQERSSHKGKPVDVSGARLEQAAAEPSNWLMYSGSYASWRFSSLEEIDAKNVSDLRLAWSLQFQTTDYFESTPVVVDGVMYLTVPPGVVMAVDAKTGEVLWRHARSVPKDLLLCCGRVNRGVAILNDRVFVGSLDGHLLALDARTGKEVWDVLVGDYREGYSITAAPLAVRGKIIVGVAGGEYGIRGFLDAYDASTGKRAWRFYTTPASGQFGSDSWSGASWKSGGGATWLTGSFDPALNLLYWGVGNPAPDYNGDSRLGDNLFTDSVLALNIDTGKLVWHFQFTPHDEHDWDSDQIPVLVDHDYEGQPRKLMLWGNRNGFYYVLDRVTGQFLRAKPFVRQNWAEGIDAKGRPILAPASKPSRRGTLTWPGHFGGLNWWSPSYSPETDLVYLPFLEEPNVFFKSSQFSETEFEAARKSKRQVVASAAGASGDPLRTGVRALDPITGEVSWQYLSSPRRDFGWAGGTLATAGNLVFYGDLNDFVAFDARNGQELWRVHLGGHINASPTTFAVAGAQEVAVPAGNVLYVFRR